MSTGKMRVLVACEESQEVCKAFRALGHESYSCDLLEPSGGHPEWHILGDCLKAIMGGQLETMDGMTHDISRWDMIIAFVPCTKTSNAGARHLYKGGKLNLCRYYEGLCGKALFSAVWAADCEKVVIENPTPSKIFDYPKPLKQFSPISLDIPTARKRCFGSAAFHRYIQRISLSLSQHGVHREHISASGKHTAEECLRQTAQECAPKPFRASQRRCPNSGAEL